MLTELQNIRKLLTKPDSENVQLATAELEKLPQMLGEISDRLLAKQTVTPDDVGALMLLKSELSGIMMLMLAALDYYDRLGLFLSAAFGEYERTGRFRALEMAPQTVVRL